MAVLILIALPALVLAFVLDATQRKLPGNMSYWWGYFFGSQGLVMGAWAFIVLIGATSRTDNLGFLLLIALFYGVPGVFVIKRRKWAWLTLSILSLNPFHWIVNWIYGSHRWAEFTREESERKAKQPGASAGSAQPTANIAVLHQTLRGEQLYNCALSDPALLKKILDLITPVASISQSQNRLELFALRLNAVHYAIFSALATDPVQLDSTLGALYARVRTESRLPLKDVALSEFVDDRRKSYASAMGASLDSVAERNDAFMETAHLGIDWSGNVPEDVGKLFGYYCGVRDPRVILTAAAAFMSALEEARLTLR